MRRRWRPLVIALTAGLFVAATAGAAAAKGNVSCDAPRAERRTRAELRQALKSKGWKVEKVQVVKGCYEISGYDPMGRKVDAFFHPRSLERVRAE